MKSALKLWSTNAALFPEVIAGYKSRLFAGLELTAVPGTFQESALRPLQESGIPVNIHAPNENLLDMGKSRAENAEILREVCQFADFFHSEYIIIHPGRGNDKDTVIKNFLGFGDARLVIENVPLKPLSGGDGLYGYNFERLRELLAATGSGFCLDFTHAIKSAASQRIDARYFIKRLLSLNPRVFHLSDGHSSIEHDEHLNLGEGDFDLGFVKDIVLSRPEAWVVFETPKTGSLGNDLKNLEYFKRL